MEKGHAHRVGLLENTETTSCFKIKKMKKHGSVRKLSSEGGMVSCTSMWLDYRTPLFNQTPIQVLR